MNNQTEREAFEAWMKSQFMQARDIPLATEAMQIMGACSEVYWIGFQAGAAYQRELDKGLVEALVNCRSIIVELCQTYGNPLPEYTLEVTDEALATYRAAAQEGK